MGGGCFFFSLCCSFSCVFVVTSECKVKTEFILWYHLPVQTRETLTEGDTALVSALNMPQHLSFPASQKFTTHALTGGVNISNMTQTVVFLYSKVNLLQPAWSLRNPMKTKTNKKTNFFFSSFDNAHCLAKLFIPLELFPILSKYQLCTSLDQNVCPSFFAK